MNVSSSVKLRNNIWKTFSVLQESYRNLQELQKLSELPDFVVVDDIGGGSQNIVQLMMSNQVVWHKSRNFVDSQNVQRTRNKSEGQLVLWKLTAWIVVLVPSHMPLHA